MNVSQAGSQAIRTLSIRTDTLDKTDNGGTPPYVFAEPYAVVTDDFRMMAESPDTTKDEKALAGLGLRMSDLWAPKAGISRKEVFQAHRGMLDSVQSEYSQPSGSNIGSILAQATLSALETSLSQSPTMVSWHKEDLSAALLGAGFESIRDSDAPRQQKSLAKKSLKVLSRFETTGQLPLAEMEKIAATATAKPA